ncbi:MAG: N-acyl homoserine lactonase family protein [Robiginitomaculum sp.]
MKRLFLPSLLILVACDNAKPQSRAPKKTAPDQHVQAVLASKSSPIKMYALECGRIEMLDLGLFDKGGAYDGRTNSAVDTCYLIRHPKGDLLWDTGLPDALHAQKDGITNGPFHISVPNTLSGQLKDLGVTPADIEFLSISHSHFDHVGNAGQYAGSTFIVNKTERAYMFRDEAKSDAQTFPAYSALETAKTVNFTGSYDVFGDGRVLIIDTPGHTPGHAILQLELKNTGTVLLTGDLYHLREAREKRTIPVFNTDADQTLASMDKFEAIAKDKNAKVIIQHSAEDFDTLPKPPEYLD